MSLAGNANRALCKDCIHTGPQPRLRVVIAAARNRRAKVGVNICHDPAHSRPGRVLVVADASGKEQGRSRNADWPIVRDYYRAWALAAAGIVVQVGFYLWLSRQGT